MMVDTPAPPLAGLPPSAGPSGSDPSMDDILASIRRILNEDELQPTSPSILEAGMKPDDTLVLDQSMLVEAGNVAPPIAQALTAQAPTAQAVAAHAFFDAQSVLPAPHEGLVAPAAAASAASSVAMLVQALAGNRGTQTHRQGPTIEDVVRDEIRPILKAWLDHHLPPLVERLVRAEIERVVSRTTP